MPPLILQDAASAVRGALGRGVLRSMSAKLLALAILFVMIAEILIFVPSAANRRTQWLTERVQAAELAALAAEAAPDDMVSEDLAAELLDGAGALAVGLMREGRSEVVLPGAPPPGPVIPVRLNAVDGGAGSIGARVQSIIDACMTFFAPEGRYLLVTTERTRMGRRIEGEFIEVLLAEAPLKTALFDYSRNIFWLSLLISFITGAALFAAVSMTFVRPMRRLARAMTRFREAPEDAARLITPSGRRDEIGDAEAALAEMQTELNQALRQKGRLAALGSAVAKINHDLRNVLTSAQLVSDRLAASPDPKVRGPAERLVRAIDRGVRLAEDVLAYGRAQEPSPQLTVVPLRAALEDAFYDAAAAVEEHTGLDMRVDDALAVEADPEHLHRIFLNLMRNAAQAMAAQAERETPGMLTLTAATEDGVVAVTVSDDGPGVPERARERLFEAFASSTRKGGSGLGLSIARELARAQGGDVVLAQTGPEGTAFEVRLRGAERPRSPTEPGGAQSDRRL